MSQRFSKPLRRVTRCTMWMVPPGLGGEGARSCWSAEGTCCAAQQHLFPSAAAGYHNLHLLLQPEAAERGITARAAQLQLAHIWRRTEVRGLHHCQMGFRPSAGCAKPELGSSCLDATLLRDGVERDVEMGAVKCCGKEKLALDPYVCIYVACWRESRFSWLL